MDTFGGGIDGEPALLRLEAGQLRQVTIVVRCGKCRRWRLRLALAVMRLAARIGGFRRVALVRERGR